MSPRAGGSVSTFARYAGLAGAAVGVVAAGAAASVLAERKMVARLRATAESPFGSLRGSRRTVIADDGLELFAEVDESDEPDRPRRTRARLPAVGFSRKAKARPPTVVFVHGYALNLDCWHFQRKALRGEHRLVFYDQRSHGRSPRSRSEHSTIEQLGSDLAQVIEQVAGDGPVVLVGHSMGGMTVMALADQHPEWFGDRVVGVALIATSSGGMTAETLGLPGLPGRLLHRITPAVIATLARTPRLVESGRRVGSDIGFVLTRKLAFGGPVPQEYVDFTDEMLAGTPFAVVADFFPGFEVHDKTAALGALRAVQTSVICGTRDAITPVEHSRRAAALVPSAVSVEIEGAGHMVILERHAQVNDALRDLLTRVEADE
jgi:pimeloyl-ACP methyl ester carboxylesterase